MANLKDLIVNGSARILGSLYANLSGNADTATKLETARTIRTNLGSTSAVGFDGSANITPGIQGTLPVANGGTGQTSIANIQAGKDADGNVISTTYAKTSSLNNYVDLTSNQTIAGNKTFSNSIVVNNNNNTPYVQKMSAIVKGTTPSSDVSSRWRLTESGGIGNANTFGGMEVNYKSNGNIITRLLAFKPEANSTEYGEIGVVYPSSGSAYSYAPTPTEDTTSSTQIDTVGARNTKLQNYLQTSDQGNLLPNFDAMPVLQTIEFDTADSNYHTICTRTNTETDQADINDVIYFRITVTGSSIHQIGNYAVIFPGRINTQPFVIANMFPGTISSTYGGNRYLAYVYPKALNSGYGWEICILNNRNTSARHYKVEVFKTNSKFTWVEGIATAYNSTYQVRGTIDVETRYGYNFNYMYGTVLQSDNATQLNNRLSKFINSTLQLTGAAVLANQFIYQNGNNVYPATDKTKAIEPGFGIQLTTSAYSSGAGIGWDNIRQKLSLTSLTNIPHDTIARGNPCYFRCTMDSNGNILSDNYVTTSMANGYTWYYVGLAQSATAIAIDTTQSFFITLDSNGKVTHINGKQVGGSGGTVDQTYDATSANAQSGVAINGAKFLKNTATGTNALTILGTASTATGGLNIGHSSSASSTYDTVIGNSSTANGQQEGAVAIGYNSTATGAKSTAIGSASQSLGNGSIALGRNTKVYANKSYSIAIGCSAECNAYGAIQLGGYNISNTEAGSLYVGLLTSGSTTNNYKLLGSNGKIPDDRLNTTIARTSDVYTKTDTEVVHTVIETYQNGTNWYRVYDDGWVEQGGRASVSYTGTDVELLREFTDTNYTVVACSAVTSTAPTINVFAVPKNVTTITLGSGVAGASAVSWYACGYGAEVFYL